MQNKIIYLISILVAIACISSFYKLLFAGEGADTGSNLSSLAYILVVGLGAIIIKKKLSTLQSLFTTILIMYMFYFGINYFLISNEIPLPFTFAYQNIWCLIGIIAYSIGRSLDVENIYKIANLLVFTVLPFITIFSFSVPESNGVGELLAGRDAYFLCIILLLWSLLMRFKFKLIVISIIFLLCIISLKRSVIIIAFFTILICLFNYITDKNNSFLKRCLTFIAIIASISYLVYNSTDLSIDIIDRFKALEDDGGSGRENIYAAVGNDIKRFYFHEFIFGKGLSSVYKLIGIQAHNDFLQIMHSLGIIGILIYISLYLCCIRKIYLYKPINIIEKKFKLYAFLIFISFAITGYLNCFIVNPPLITPFIFLLGVSIGIIDNSKLKRKR